MIKDVSFKTKGMTRDLAVSVFSPEYAYENMNMRYQTSDDNSLMVLTNERSSKFMGQLMGTVLGHCNIDDKLMVFTHKEDGSEKNPDYIYLIQMVDNEFTPEKIYQGNLGFDLQYPIEAFSFIETEAVKKVFWTDYKNPVRCINIANYQQDMALWDDNSFNFNLKYSTVAKGTVTKQYTTGVFPAGVIQYVATYYNKYMQESNIIWYSPLLYISPKGRGGAADETVSNSFKIELKNLDAQMDYVRIYSIIRTSKDTTPIVRRVTDIRIKNEEVAGSLVKNPVTTIVASIDNNLSMVDKDDDKTLPTITFNVYKKEEAVEGVTGSEISTNDTSRIATTHIKVNWQEDGIKSSIKTLNSILQGEITDEATLTAWGFPTDFGGIYFRDAIASLDTTEKTGYANTNVFYTGNGLYSDADNDIASYSIKTSPFNANWSFTGGYVTSISDGETDETNNRVLTGKAETVIWWLDLEHGMENNQNEPRFFLSNTWGQSIVPFVYSTTEDGVTHDYKDFMSYILTQAKEYWENLDSQADYPSIYKYLPPSDDENPFYILHPNNEEEGGNVTDGVNPYKQYVIFMYKPNLYPRIWRRERWKYNNNGNTVWENDRTTPFVDYCDNSINLLSSDEWVAIIPSISLEEQKKVQEYLEGNGTTFSFDYNTESDKFSTSPKYITITTNFKGFYAHGASVPTDGSIPDSLVAQIQAASTTDNGLIKWVGKDSNDSNTITVGETSNTIPDSVSEGKQGYFIDTVTSETYYEKREYFYNPSYFKESSFDQKTRLCFTDISNDADAVQITGKAWYNDKFHSTNCAQPQSLSYNNSCTFLYLSTTLRYRPQSEYTTSVTFEDNNTQGETIDATELLYKEKSVFTAKTMATKANSLFLGNIKLLNSYVGDTEAYNKIQEYKNDSSSDMPHFETQSLSSTMMELGDSLDYDSYDVTTFKRNEYYRFGIQLQYEDCSWSSVIYLNDVENTNVPQMGMKTIAEMTLESNIGNELIDLGYKAVRPVVVYPSLTERQCMFQGAVCPTMFNLKDRLENAPYAQMSYIARPQSVETITDTQTHGLSESGYYYDPNWSYGEMLYDSDGNESDLSKALGSHNRWAAGDVDYAEFRHWGMLQSNDYSNCEIQNTWAIVPWLNAAEPINNLDLREDSDVGKLIMDNLFYVDTSIVSVHSPEVQWDGDIQNLDTSDLKFRIIGSLPLYQSNTNIDIQLEATTTQLNSEWDVYTVYGPCKKNEDHVFYATKTYINGCRYSKKHTNVFGKGQVLSNIKVTGANGWKQPMATLLWQDQPSMYLDSGNIKYLSTQGLRYMIYPWQKTGRINGSLGQDNDKKESVLEKKVISYYKKSMVTSFQDATDKHPYWTPLYGSCTKVFNGVNESNTTTANSSGMVALDSQIGEENTYNYYYSNIDKVIAYGTGGRGLLIDANGSSTRLHNADIYPVQIGYQNNDFYYIDADWLTPDSAVATKKFLYPYSTWIALDSDKQLKDTSPVSMKYKALPHAVVSFNYTTTNEQNNSKCGVVCLPSSSYIGLNEEPSNIGTGTPFKNGDYPYFNSYLANKVTDISKYEPYSDDRYTKQCGGYLYLGELYRTNVTPFGGTTEEILKNNQWIIAGDTVELKANDSCVIQWKQGDTYLQRFEALRTIPYTEDDENQMVDIVSFICESRINMDGRYDRNRNLSSYLNVRDTNFNLMNDVYSQQANYFVQQYLTEDDSINDFPNQIAFSLTKSLGEDTDSWMNMTLASTVDTDASLGQIHSLQKLNDSIVIFQEKGISELMYNSNVQVASTTGVPIEIANSQKVEGIRVITDKVGCDNKWAITDTSKGIYFVSTDYDGLYLFNGSLTNISTAKGFQAWLQNKYNRKEWTPSEGGTRLTYYKKRGDIFYNDGTDCLAYNENLEQFTSFYNYEEGSLQANYLNNGLWFVPSGNSTYMYYLEAGDDYGCLLDQYAPYYTTVIANAEPQMDKIFNNLEFRADVLKIDTANKLQKGDLTPILLPFDKLTVWNEYQEGEETLTVRNGRPSNLKQKFRIWRANIPRDKQCVRDRMRNPWLYLKLESGIDNQDNNIHSKAMLHDLRVWYYE